MSAQESIDPPRVAADTELHPLPRERTLDGTLGFVTDELGEQLATGHVDVTDRVRQRWGIVHGGVYAALAELIASEATNSAVKPDGKAALGLSNLTSFLRPVSAGRVNAQARRLHRGSTTWVWEVEMTDDAGKLCATSRVTVAVRPPLPVPDRTG